ncbi:hypothetical protein C4K09_3602 [Pseudomonas chlororaphis subsp. aureofaciens]|uniref:RelA/SpoT domain-containing protein n=1 Tax=Pseudomonas chlororaphis TaxID=587753 RepID=UPI000F56857D|nr:RelA/SpoT domain-containing protein [Pseudomonas chlororaphis]AZD99673.1 hypothetical protein C4K12_3810 [Pseudomonas chlororaphis subsp. aureofaciens]AZE18060.1 hypothetical protein C4K09_3602 [Pseudomonas chlororaphis subsp. aureofaciens]
MANLEEVTAYCLEQFGEIEHELSLFKSQVQGWFDTHPKLSKCKPPIVHSVKSRLKDREHLAEKISRKLIGDAINQTEEREGWVSLEVFGSLTDLAGVRVLLLHQKQYGTVHSEIIKKINSGDWALHEEPKAYTWDPDSASYFESLGIGTKVKDSHYTSVHYVIRPRAESPLVCEVQVRTLFEEIWGEVDHTLNYPSPTESIACKEQLRVLAKVVGAGSRLVDSIFNSAEVPTLRVEQPEGTHQHVEQPAVEHVGAIEAIPPTEKPAPETLPEGVPENPEVRIQR